MTALLNVEGLTLSYKLLGDRSVDAVYNASLEVPSRGDTVGIVGESGSGKTSMAMSILNLIEPPGKITQGEVLYNGKNVLEMTEKELTDYRWKEVAMIYQAAMNSLDPVKKCIDPIVEVLLKHRVVSSKSEAREFAIKALENVRINPKFVDFYPFELSGGMKQRVVTALALALSPAILIADEPTSALDVVTQNRILDTLRHIVSSRQMSLIFITHEISLLKNTVENIYVMYRGRTVETGPIRPVLSEPLHPYTEALVQTALALEAGEDSKSVREDWEALRRGRAISAQKGSGVFAARCKYATGKCSVEEPVLHDVGKGRWVACH